MLNRYADGNTKRRIRFVPRPELLEPRHLLAAQPIISEIVASNGTTLLDGDGNSSDWIEIYNRGDASVNLEGWHLTDDTGDLTKWTFPDVNLGAGQYFVVFASGQDVVDYVDGSGGLHTNFRLSANGEYLALVEPDGTTIAYEFAPEFPPQLRDVSYGLELDATVSQTLVDANAVARVTVPNGPIANWAEPDFDDAAWTAGPTGIGFENLDDTTLPDGLVTFFGFDEQGPSSTTLELISGNQQAISGNGAFVAGQVNNALDFDGTTHVDLDGHPNGLRNGFTLAAWIQPDSANRTIMSGHSSNLRGGFWLGYNAGGPWLGISAGAGSENGATGSWVNVNAPDAMPTLGQWYHLAVTFDSTDTAEEVKFYVDGRKLTSGVSNANVNDGQMGDASSTPFRIGLHSAGSFPFDGRMDDVAVFDRPLSELEISALAENGAVGGGPIFANVFETDIENEMYNVNSTAYVRIPFDIADVTGLDTMTLRMKYDDGFVALVNGAEVVRSNTPQTPAWNSAAAAERNPADALSVEAFDISQHLGLLSTTDTNLLAIQGLNASVSDPEFIVVPELIVASVDEALSYFPVPTPGAANTDGLAGFVEDTRFSEDRGFFDAPFDLTISTDTPGAEIRYTNDGTEPTPTNGEVYVGPLEITTTTTLRAAAFKAGLLPTNVDTQTYLFLEDVIRQPALPEGLPPTWGGYYIGPVGSPVPADYEMNQTRVNEHADTIIDDMLAIPTLSIVMDHDGLFDIDNGIYPNPFISEDIRERATSIEWIDPDGQDRQVDAGIRVFGGWSRHFHATPKKSFALRFRTEYGPGRLEFPLFDRNQVDSKIEPAEDFETILLRGVFSDAWPDAASPPQYLRDYNTRLMQLAMGQPSSHGTWVHLYLNGHYWGIYNPSERPDADFAASYGGGDPSEYDAVKHEGLCNPGCATNNQFEVIDGGQAAQQGFQAALDLAAQGLADPDNYRQFKQLVDVENLADYILLEHYVGNVDWPHKNWYATRKREGGNGWKFYVWDSEYTLRNVTDSRISANNPNTPAFLWNAARQNAEFRSMFADRAHKHMFNDGALQPAANIARYEALAAEIEGPIKAEAARWGDASATRMGVTNYSFADWDSIRNGILNNYFPQRHAIALSQLRSAGLYPNIDAPEFNQFGGTVDTGFELTMTAPTGAIFYTIDGSDPRGDTLPELLETRALISEGATATALVPTDGTLGTNWTEVGFNDASWLTGTTGVGYERSAGYEALLGIDLLSGDIPASQRIDTNGDGTNENGSVYVRIPFDVDGDVSAYDYLALRMKYDDGFVAYLNGQEVARGQAPESVTWNSTATSDHPDSQATSFSTFNISTHVDLLQSGTNVLAVHGLNVNLTSSDMLIIPELEIGMTDQGGQPSMAIEYTGPITINANTHIKARVQNGNEWSALTEATFVPEPIPSIRVTEILYNSAGATDTEFIELQNTGSQSINLDGIQFTEGIGYTFGDVDLAPNERIVVVSDQMDFEAAYGPLVPVAGEFNSGGLSNAGEQIQLMDAFGRTIQDFEYQDGWYPITDGLGFSMTILDASAAVETWNDKESWRPSAMSGGTPGGADISTLPTPGDILFSELLSHADDADGTWIELQNTTGQPIDIGNWYLSDDSSDPEKVRLAAELTIPASGYLVLTEASHYGSLVEATNGFTLSKFGGEISLTAGTVDGSLAGFQVERNYSAADVNATLGIVATSDGRTDFVALTIPSPGAANRPPRVGPVVINEVMYHPVADGDEFIELLNISNQTVSLSDTADPNKSWQLDGAIEYSFPPSIQLQPGEHLLIVPIAPGEFRTKYNIPADVTALGPYDGSMDNGGESVRLEKLGAANPEGEFAEILVDRVQYNDLPPWPTAPDGNGPSLERIDPSGYGNEPTNWMRSAFGGSPGVLNVGIDFSPPSMPTNVVVTDTAFGEAHLSWTPAVDSQSSVLQYEIYRDGELAGATDGSTTEFVDKSRPAGGQVSYRVLAVNGDGVPGLPSRSAEVTGHQDGLSPTTDYAGTDDTMLAESAPTTSFGAEISLLVSNDNPADSRQESVALLRWDLSTIPADATVQSAAVTLNLTASTGQTFDVFAATRDWVANEANWNQAANGQAWQSPGASGELDRSSTQLGSIGPAGTSQRTIQLNSEGVALVQQWINGTAVNHGFVVVPSSDAPQGNGGAALEDLIAFYTFDTLVDGTATDLSTNGLDGTIEGTVNADLNGFDGGAYRFNGSGHVEAPININPSVRPKLTMGAWVKSDPVLPGLYKILGHDNGGWDRTLGLDNRQGPFRWTSFVGDRRPVTPTVEPVPDQWSFVAAVYDNAARTVTVYIDIDATTTDDPLQAFTEPTNFNPGQNTVAIGSLRPDNFAEGFLGLMDNVFFFNEALSAEEMSQLRTSGAGYFVEGGLQFDSSDSPNASNRPTMTLAFTESTQPGDITGDGAVNAIDIDAICQAIDAGSTAEVFDVDGNSSVNTDDVTTLVQSILGTQPGDANLDRRIDAQDLNQVGIHWQQSGVDIGWGSGDFNCSGSVDAQDLNDIGLNWQLAPQVARIPRAPLAMVGVWAHDDSPIAFPLADAALTDTDVTDAEADTRMDTTSIDLTLADRADHHHTRSRSMRQRRHRMQDIRSVEDHLVHQHVTSDSIDEWFRRLA